MIPYIIIRVNTVWRYINGLRLNNEHAAYDLSSAEKYLDATNALGNSRQDCNDENQNQETIYNDSA